MPSKRFTKNLTIAVVLILCAAFVIKFAGPNILKQYISYGIGTCKNIPILCRQPEEKTMLPKTDKDYLKTLIPQRFPMFSVSTPRRFNLVQELIKRKYYKRKRSDNDPVIYLIFQEPGALVKLYPDVRKDGVENNREFIRRMSYADLDKINGINDAFFVIMKSIFTPDIGNQNTAKMIKFELGNKSGFINYNLIKNGENYFDCNVVDEHDDLFKVYIKDTDNRLDLNKVFTIISTLKPVN